MALERRRLGRTGLEVSVLGLGGSEIGFESADAATVDRILGEALDVGVNVIDTAECYETSEETIGRVLGSRRDRVHLFTKCGHPDGWGRSDWTAASLLATVERSLRRLATDRVDLLQLHSSPLDVLRRGEAIEALERARERGLARYVGYSGDGAAARFAIECGRFDVLQTSVSVADQEAIDLLLPLARERDLGVIAKRPLANAAWRHRELPEEEYPRPYWRRLRELDYPFLRGDAEKGGATALRFTTSVPGVHVAIVGTARPGRVASNARGLAAGPLPAADFEAIRRRWRDVARPTWVGQT